MTRATYFGLFLVALATLMFEILLTRIFSATTWYHFAFMAISVAMFGMTAGAIAVYLAPRFFTRERAPTQLAGGSAAFALAMPICFLAHLAVPFIEESSAVGIFSFALTYTLVSIPFFLSGVVICIALTKFPERVGSLYAADLAGAALGCVLLIVTLRYTDGPTAVFVVAALGALGAMAFGIGSGSRRQVGVSAALLALFAVATVWHTGRVEDRDPWVRVYWTKGRREATPPDYERWNSFSRIAIRPYFGGGPTKPFGWGLSEVCEDMTDLRQQSLLIDGLAGTVITEFDGDISKLGHLKCDVTNMAHYLRDDARVLVVGIGGGRDLLSALAFEQEHVTGVEMNGNTIEALNGEFGELSGHLDRNPKVTFVHDEARSWVSRTDETFDIVQISLIDTWAATSAGAFVLAENSLYTLEAWETIFDRLSDDGILTVSRWYKQESPGEIYRTVSLAEAALREHGVETPRDHMMLVRTDPKFTTGIGTLLVSMQPFGLDEVERMTDVAARLQFEVVLGPDVAVDPALGELAEGEPVSEFPGGVELNLSPPTDDRPFFFNMIRLGDLLDASVWDAEGLDANLKAVRILGVLLAIVVVLTLGCFVLPLAWTTRRGDLRGAAPLFGYFASIGFGFMLVELSQMHRLILFLGHPTYGLSVVLFALLVSSGTGSYLSRDTGEHSMGRVLGALLVALVAFGVGTPYVVGAAAPLSTPLRVGIAVLLLFPIGLLMGTAFPMGLRLAADRSPRLTPWLWGINGATGVCASVLSTAIALTFSISTAFWTGAAFYVLAWLSHAWARRMPRAAATEGAAR